MQLITKEIENKFKSQGDTSSKEMKDIKIICKLFNPCDAGTWYLYEHIEDDIYMCFADLGDPMCAEIGTVSLNEVKSVRLPFGLTIERDMHYGFEHTLKEVYDAVKER